METVEARLRSLLMHDGFVRGIARGLVSDAASVDDIVQETWWAGITKRSVSVRPILPWLAKVTRHLALNSRRSEARRHAREIVAAVPEAQPSTAAIIEREAVRRSVVESVLGLPEPFQGAIVLRYFEGLAPREIARRIGVPVETVRSRLKRAIAILREKLDPVDVEARKSFGAALLAIAHGPQLPVAISAAAAGNAVLLGALAMSTGTKIAAILAALLIVVGVIVVPPYLASRDREVPGEQTVSPSSDAPIAVANRERSAPIRPRPYSESEPTENAPSVATALEVELIGPTGRPASSARLLIHRGKEVLAQATTNADGLAGLGPGEGEAELIVLPDGAPVHFTTISLASGRRRVQLPPGQSISGRVEVNGGSPSEAIKLTFDPTVDDLRIVEFWEALRSALSPTCTAAPSGEFEFAGLPDGSEWRIGSTLRDSEWRSGTSSGYRVEEVTRDGRPVVVVTAPATGVVVKLRKLPVVRGRILSADGHVPVAGVRADVMRMESGTDTMSGLGIQDDGRFSFAVEPLNPGARLTRIRIVVEASRGFGGRSIVLDPVPDRDHDVGDIELPSGRTIRFVVRDPDGKPIEGAVARVDRETASRTNAEGLGSILVGPDISSLRIGALKHEVADVAVPSPLPDVLPVVLKPNGGLEIRVLTNPPSTASSIMVRVSADVPEIVGPGTIGNDPVYVSAGATPTASGSGLGPRGCSFDFVPIDARVVVAGLKPGIPLTVTVVDALRNALASTVVTLGPAEWRTVALQVSKTGRSLRGRVLDPARQPVLGARVAIYRDPERAGARHSGPDEIRAETDAEGRFVLDGIFQETVHFAVNKAGFVALIQRDLALPAENGELVVTLQKGCELRVKIVDDRDAPIRKLEWHVRATVAGYPAMTSTEKQPGEYLFADFPMNVEATLRVRWAGAAWSRTIAVKGDHTERIKMPPTGALVVDYSALGAPTADTPYSLHLTWTGEMPGALGSLIPAPAPGSPQLYELPTLLPGDYTATLVLGEGHADRERRSASESFHITAGQTTRVVFRKN